MSPAEGERRRTAASRVISTALAVIVLAPLAVLAGSPAAVAAARPSYRVAIHLRSMTPIAPKSHGHVQLTGMITNTGKEPLYDVAATFWINQTPLTTRGELAEAAGERPGLRLGTRIYNPYDLVDQVSGKLNPGHSAPFRLDVPVADLGMHDPGVYLVGADIRFTPPDTGQPASELRQTVGRLRTFLPYLPKHARATPVQLAFLVPLVAGSGLVSGNTVAPGRSSIFDPRDRLSSLLKLGQDTGVTWLVDPAVLAQARVLANHPEYLGGGAVPARVRRNARAWLERARQVLQPDSTLLLPYGDPDLSALAHHHLTGVWSEAATAAESTAASAGLHWPTLGGGADGHPTSSPSPTGSGTPSPSSTTRSASRPGKGAAGQPDHSSPSPSSTPTKNESATSSPTPHPGGQSSGAPHRGSGTAVSPNVLALPGRGYADAATLEAAADNGLRTVLLSANALPARSDPVAMPLVSLATPAGPVTALVTAPSFTGRGSAGTADDPRQGVAMQQRLLSETALIALHADRSRPPRVVALAQRTWDPGASIRSLFAAIRKAPWLSTVSARALIGGAPTAYGGRVSFPRTARRAELGGAAMDSLQALDRESQVYTSMLVKPAKAVGRLSRALLRASSISWRHDPAGAVELSQAVRGQTEQTMARIHVVTPRFVTLSSRSGRFPVTISNDTRQEISVGLHVHARLPGRLKVDPIKPVRVAPHRKSTVSVSVHAPAGGVVQLTVGLATPTGVLFGIPHDFAVRVTEYGVFGWVVMGVGLGLLFLASGLRLVRRSRRSRASRDGEATTS